MSDAWMPSATPMRDAAMAKQVCHTASEAAAAHVYSRNTQGLLLMQVDACAYVFKANSVETIT